MNDVLPINDHKAAFFEAFENNPVTIVVADTGAGKSTQIPQWLTEWIMKAMVFAGVIVTQPRRPAATTLARRVAAEMGVKLGDLVGFHVSGKPNKGKRTKLLFVTDGLAVEQQLALDESYVLVIDEVHEWNKSISLLIGWVKYQLNRGVDMKVVIMSATMDASGLSAFLDDAPIVSVPNRQFDIVDLDPGDWASMEDCVADMLRLGRNTLVFLPGKKEIGDMAKYLRSTGVDAEIIELHGEMTPDEQETVMLAYDRPKCVLATNVAQTSLTIPDIDCVVDSGTERRMQVVKGVPVLSVESISRADRKQRRGRAGRTKDGWCVDFCDTPWEERPEHPTPEMLRTLIEDTVLELLRHDINPMEFEFFHPLDAEDVADAMRTLGALGCVDADDVITDIGRQVNKLPMTVFAARMVVEAIRLGVVDDVATIAAIFDTDGIVDRDREARWLNHFAKGETESDLLAQLDVYKKAPELSKAEMREKGVHSKRYYDAAERRRQLVQTLKGNGVLVTSSGDRSDIIRAIMAGSAHTLFRLERGLYIGSDNAGRKIGFGSVTEGQDHRWVVGKALDLPGREGRPGTRLLNMVTAVDPAMVATVAPQILQASDEATLRYDAGTDSVVARTEVSLNGTVIGTVDKTDTAGPQADKLLREGRKQATWKEWLAAAPSSDDEMPDIDDPRVAIPDIVTVIYGVDDETGEPLEAYGIYQCDFDCGSFGSPFELVWTRNYREARQVLTESRSDLPELLDALRPLRHRLRGTTRVH